MAKRHTAIDYALVTQVILLQPTAETTDEALAAFFKAVHHSQPHIPCLVAGASGENTSNAHRGFTHGILLHFDHDPHEAKAHPKYQGLIAKARSLCDQVIIFELPETFSVPVPASLLESAPGTAPAPEPASKRRGRPHQQQRATSLPPAPRMPERPAWQAWSADSIDPRLKNIVIEQLGVDESQVVPHASLVEDLNADSLDLVEYIMSVEEVFKVEIPDEDAEKLTTVGETEAYLQDSGVL